MSSIHTAFYHNVTFALALLPIHRTSWCLISTYTFWRNARSFDCEAISTISIIIYIMKNIAQTANMRVSSFKYFHEYFLLICLESGKVSHKWFQSNMYLQVYKSDLFFSRINAIISLCIVSRWTRQKENKKNRR